jgi:hypothetical protein
MRAIKLSTNCWVNVIAKDDEDADAGRRNLRSVERRKITTALFDFPGG